MPKTKLGINIDRSIEKIMDIPNCYLARDDTYYGYLINSSGNISVDDLSPVSGSPEIYYSITRVLGIPLNRKNNVLAGFLKKYRRKFYIVCSQMYTEYDYYGNEVGKLTPRGGKAFEELERLICELDDANEELSLIDPDMYFYDVRSLIGDAQTVEDAIEVAIEMTQDSLEECNNLAADWKDIRRYAIEIWNEFNSSDND